MKIFIVAVFSLFTVTTFANVRFCEIDKKPFYDRDLKREMTAVSCDKNWRLPVIVHASYFPYLFVWTKDVEEFRKSIYRLGYRLIEETEKSKLYMVED